MSQVFIITSHAAMNSPGCIFRCTHSIISAGIYLAVDVLDHRVYIELTVGEYSKECSKVVVQNPFSFTDGKSEVVGEEVVTKKE